MGLFFSKTKPKNVLFDHLPKCGGSSLNLYLESNFKEKHIFRIDGSNPYKSVDQFKSFNIKSKRKYRLIRGHLANQLIGIIDQSFLKITMLREPIDRIVSHYYYAKRSKSHYLYAYIHDNDVSLLEYVTSGKSNELQNWYVSHFSGLSFAEVKQNPIIALNLALERINENYDIVGFTDDFHLFTEQLRKKDDFDKPYNNLKVNVTINRHNINDISSEILNPIRELNTLDIELYNTLRDKYKK